MGRAHHTGKAGAWPYRLQLSVLLSLALLGCGTTPLVSKEALAQPADKAGSEQRSQSASQSTSQSTGAGFDSQLMFEIMIAELAGRRGQLDVAMAGYLQASKRTDDPRISERAARLAIFGRQWAEAEKAARRWIELDSTNLEAPQLLAQTLLYQDDVEGAATLFVENLRVSDNVPRSLQSIQFELERHNNTNQSLAIMNRIRDAFPDEPEAHLGLARTSILANDRESALLAVESALELSPGSIDALLLQAQILSAMGRPDEGFSSIKAALDADSGNTSLRLGYAQLLVAGGRFDSVGEQLDLIYEDDKQNAETLLTISLLALEARRLDRAATYLKDLQATGKHPNKANFYLARIKDQQQEYEQAIALYDAVGGGDLQVGALIRAAELTALTGDLEKGRARLRDVASTMRNPALQPRLISAESRMLQQADQAGEAVVVLTEGLTRFPDNADLLYARALTADAAGDGQTLVDDLSRLIELEPDNAHALNALGYHYVDNNIELVEAEVLLEKAIAILPTDPAIMDSVGWLRYRQGNFDEAVEHLRAAYELYPDPEIAAHLGEALWFSGAETEAEELIRQALLENPEDARLLSVKQIFRK